MRRLPGAPDLLTATAQLGLHVVLASSAKDDEIGLMLDATGARDAIGTVASSGAVERAKPDPDIVERALGESGTDRARAVMVGDAVWDVIAARRGIPCIGLLSGGMAEEQLRRAGAHRGVPRRCRAARQSAGQHDRQAGERAAHATLGQQAAG
jgi:phosphoglycolate phosphatase-like HAD superfamily hydrolase